MFNQLCLLLAASLSWPHVSSRNVVLPPFYTPYSDYSYIYPGAAPTYQQHHSPYFAPPGTYFDQRQGIFRPFPGGGVPVLVDYHKRCSNQYVGLKAHPDQQQYYYVCKPNCVIFGKCQNLQIFNATSGQCIQHPPPDYKPTCTEVGRFPLFSDCHLYYKCEDDLQPKIYSCPIGMVFSPASRKCISGNKCIPTQISPDSSYIPEVCVNKFPPCFENGMFRSPSDCSLYYKCDLNKDGFYVQTRLRCPQGNFYDLHRNECLPSKEVPCDCIQVAELVYPKPNHMPFPPAIYPAQYDFNSLEEGQYPVEQSKEELGNFIVEEVISELTTTLAPPVTSMGESAVLSDYIDIAGEAKKFQSEEQGKPAAISSEELPSNEADSAETDNHHEVIENTTVADQLQPEALSFQEEDTVEETTNKETSNKLSKVIAHPANSSTEEPLAITEAEVETSDFVEIQTTATSLKLDRAEEATTVENFAHSEQPRACQTLIRSDDSDDPDAHTNKTFQTQIKKCSIQEVKPDSRTIRHKQNTTTIQTLNNIQLSTTKLDQLSIDTVLAPAKNNSLTHQLETAKDEILFMFTPPTKNLISANEIKDKNLNERAHDKKISNLSIQNTDDNDTTEELTNLQTIEETPKTLNIGKTQIQTKKESTISLDKRPHLKIGNELALTKERVKVNNLDTAALVEEHFNANTLLDEELLAFRVKSANPSATTNHVHTSTKEKSVALRQIDFSAEEFIPVQLKTINANALPEETTDFETDFSDDYTTVIADKELVAAATTKTTARKNVQEQEQLDVSEKIGSLWRSETATGETTSKHFTEAATVPSTELFSALTNAKVNSRNARSEELLDFLDRSAEVSNNEIISAEGVQKISRHQQFSHTLSNTSTPKQMSRTTSPKNTISKSRANLDNNLILHIRKPVQEHSSLDSRQSKTLFYLLKNTPVISNSANNSNIQTISGLSTVESIKENIPRLEIIAERPIDVHLSICPSTCGKNHQHNKNSAIGKRAVLLKWFANKSNQTLGFETANDANIGDESTF